MYAGDFRAPLIAGLACFACLAPAVAAETPKPPVTVTGPFEHKIKDGKDKYALSGIDCLSHKADGSNLCLVVDDELKLAQFATLAGNTLTAGDAKEIFKDNNGIVGKPPHKLDADDAPSCQNGGEDKGELDGEAIAHIGTTFYVVGSHGCGRTSKEYKSHTFVLSRISTDSEAAGKPENTYQLSRAILRSDILKSHFGKDLDKTDKGISIEGMTASADGKSLIFALRSPSLDGNAFLVMVRIDPLFQEGDGPKKKEIEVHAVFLGKDIGFRDIERLPDGRFLALTGPAGEMPESDNGPFTLRVFDSDFSLGEQSAAVPALNGGSPEAIEWLEDGRVLILSDDAENGGAQTISFTP